MFLQVSVCPRGVYTLLDRHPQADTFQAYIPMGTPPALADTPPREMATAADGTQPNGMHSC